MAMPVATTTVKRSPSSSQAMNAVNKGLLTWKMLALAAPKRTTDS